MMINTKDGRTMSNTEFQERIRNIVKLTGRYILSCSIAPQIGQIQTFAGLPFRAVRIISFKEALEDFLKVDPSNTDHDPGEVYFEVEVAD